MYQPQWPDIQQKLARVYGKKAARELTQKLKRLIKRQNLPESPQDKRENPLDLEDVCLISYANSIENKKEDEPSLQAMQDFIRTFNLTDSINTLHLLPFYPWDTDRGFSVVDFYKMGKEYGDWEDVKSLSEDIHLMVDFVANHASIKNPMVQSALIAKHLDSKDKRYKKHKRYKDFVLAYTDRERPSKKALKKLARPRSNPVLTPYSVVEKKGHIKAVLGKAQKTDGEILGEGWVWTTFSRPKSKDGTEDTRQVDLNFANSNVFLESIKILLFYIEKGPSLIRLDAIGYIWKKLGSNSLHEKEAHIILDAMTDILNICFPKVITIAEVNEPQNTILPYLGKGDKREADLVYQFTHFPLAIHAVFTEDGSYYTKWLKTLEPFGGRQFITTMGSHDGLGLKPVRKILPEEEISKLTRILIEEHKSLPNYAYLPGDKKIVYEICATPFNLINNPGKIEDFATQLQRYLVVVALSFPVRGMPAFYFNGLIGAKNFLPESGLDENRTINREVFEKNQLFRELKLPSNNLHQVFTSVSELLVKRAQQQAFDPKNPLSQPVKASNKSLVAVWVPEAKKGKGLLSVINLSEKSQNVEISLPKIGKKTLTDVFSGKKLSTDKSNIKTSCSPYQILWLV